MQVVAISDACPGTLRARPSRGRGRQRRCPARENHSWLCRIATSASICEKRASAFLAMSRRASGTNSRPPRWRTAAGMRASTMGPGIGAQLVHSEYKTPSSPQVRLKTRGLGREFAALFFATAPQGVAQVGQLAVQGRRRGRPCRACLDLFGAAALLGQRRLCARE